MEISKSELILTDAWSIGKCYICAERYDCYLNNDKKIFKKKEKLIGKLGFCEDYIVDHSRISIDRKQVYHEERTFDEMFNKGRFPIDLDEKLGL